MKRVLITILLLLSFSSFSKDEIRKIGLQKNNLFPEINLISVDGKEQISSKELEGKKTIYNFVTTWCSYCREERPILNNFYIKNKDEINVVSIFMGESSKQIEQYIKKYPVEFKSYHDKNGEIGNKFFIRGTPTSYIVDENGVIIARITGALNWGLITVGIIKSL